MKNKILLIAGLLFFVSSCSFFSPAQNNAVLSFVVDGDMAREVQKSLGNISSLPLVARVLEGENALLEISIFGDYSDSKTIALVDGESLSFTNLSEGQKIYAQGSVYINEKSADGKESRKELYAGKSESFVIKRGINDLELTLYKVKAEAEEKPEIVEPEQPEEPEPTDPEPEEPTPSEPEEPAEPEEPTPSEPEEPDEAETPEEPEVPEVITVEYKVLHYKQNLSDDEFTLVEEDSQTLSGQTGSLTEAKAKEYEGFTCLDFEQKELSETDNDISIKYVRNVHKVIYVDAEDEDNPEILEQIEYKYGETVNISFDNYEAPEGFKFSGWAGEDETIYSPLLGLNNSFVMGDEDVILVAIVLPLPEEAVETGLNITLSLENSADINVAVLVDGAEITESSLISAESTSELVFDADSTYESYLWKINGEEVTSSSEIATVDGNKLTITMSQTASSFIYDITLLASKIDSETGEALYHSYSAQIKKN